MYNDYISEREKINAETFALFSHRPDVKAKRNYISSAPKRKRNEINIDAILAFLSSVILFITYVCIYFF